VHHQKVNLRQTRRQNRGEKVEKDVSNGRDGAIQIIGDIHAINVRSVIHCVGKLYEHDEFETDFVEVCLLSSTSMYITNKINRDLINNITGDEPSYFYFEGGGGVLHTFVLSRSRL
jgi:hypothetical protein